MSTLYAGLMSGYAEKNDRRPFGLAHEHPVHKKHGLVVGKSCRECSGDGYVDGVKCDVCEGRGYVLHMKVSVEEVSTMTRRTHEKKERDEKKREREMKRGLEETLATVKKVEKAKAAWRESSRWMEE